MGFYKIERQASEAGNGSGCQRSQFHMLECVGFASSGPNSGFVFLKFGIHDCKIGDSWLVLLYAHVPICIRLVMCWYYGSMFSGGLGGQLPPHSLSLHSWTLFSQPVLAPFLWS